MRCLSVNGRRGDNYYGDWLNDVRIGKGDVRIGKGDVRVRVKG